MRLKLRLIAAVLVAVAAGSTWADGRVASKNFFTNLSRAKGTLPVTESTAAVTPTLVRGMYAISKKQDGFFVGYTNEAGTLFGSIAGFKVLSTTGSPVRLLTADEANDLRSEVIAGIELDKLPKVVHGNGGGRSLLLFTALDCPTCKIFEDNMRKASTGVNTTFYIVPRSLQPIASGGLPRWQAVSNIWCAENSGAAWLDFWANRKIPQTRACENSDPKVAENNINQLVFMLIGTGVKVTSTPNMLSEDGSVSTSLIGMSAAQIKDTFGPTGMPQVTSKPAHWLVASN